MNEDDEDGEEHDDYAAIAGENDAGFSGGTKGYNIDRPNFLLPMERIDEHLQTSMVELDVQDESCTSYERLHGAGSCGLANIVVASTV